MRGALLAGTLALSLAGCMSFDGFMFAGKRAASLDDYHGLPVCGDPSSPYCPAHDDSLLSREIYLTTPDGQVIPKDNLAQHDQYVHAALLHGVPDGPLSGQGITAQFIHGNSGDMFRYWVDAVILWRLGMNVLIYTWRGYGLSPGTTTQETVFEDARAAATYLHERAATDAAMDPSRIGVYGHSLGSVPAAYLLGDDSGLAGLFAFGILDAPLESIAAATDQSSVVSMPAGFYSNADQWDTIDRMAGATVPILHLHGQKDEVNFFYQAENIRLSFSQSLADYTAYVGLGGPGYAGFSEELDELMRQAHHRHLPFAAYQDFDHISTLFEAADNPGHCCLDPHEFLDPENSDFLRGRGGAEAIHRSNQAYNQALSDWLLTKVVKLGVAP